MSTIVYLRPPGGGTTVQLPVPFGTLDYSRRVNVGGVLTMTLDPNSVPSTAFQKNARLEVWRGDSGVHKLEMKTCWFVRKWETATDDDGVELLTVTALDALSLLARRDIPYPSGTTYTDKNGFADDLARDLVRENFGASAFDTARDASAYLTAGTNQSSGAIVIMDVAKKNIVAAIKDLADASEAAGVKFAYDVTYSPSSGLFSFVTWVGFLGRDRTLTSASPLIFDFRRGNLARPVLTRDYMDEANYIYAYGQGDGVEQAVKEASDPLALTDPLARVEATIDAKAASEEAVQAEANAELKMRRGREYFSGSVLSVPGSLYGRDWSWGDGVVGQYKTQTFNCTIDYVRVTVDNQNGEQIDARLSGEREL